MLGQNLLGVAGELFPGDNRACTLDGLSGVAKLQQTLNIVYISPQRDLIDVLLMMHLHSLLLESQWLYIIMLKHIAMS